MRKTILLYALLLALLVFVLKLIEYRFLIRDLSLEFYVGIVAIMFTALGVWAGLKLTRKNPTLNESINNFVRDEARIQRIGISKRELEVLELMATGLSNQEIADQLFVSLNTVKTHSSNLFIKLEVKRRTQAVQKAKDIKLIG
jgi:NarL family two-component system response regulator LiaR